MNGILKPLKNGPTGVDFETSGILYLLPNITNTAAATPGQVAPQSDIYKLRVGQTLADKVIGFGYGFANNKPSLPRDQINRVGGVRVDAKDYASAPAAFFGDRPLDNPGYSKMELTGGVGAGQTNAKLDILKVEQRLKYLGFSAFNKASEVAAVPGTPRVPVEFKVDGQFDASSDELALRGFYGATHYKYNSGSNSNGMGSTNIVSAKTVQSTGGATSTLGWLNAYNAPHWINTNTMLSIPYATGSTTPDWQSGQGSKKEIYSTSWTADILRAAQLQRVRQTIIGTTDTLNPKTNTGVQKVIRLNVFADPTVIPPNTHNSGGHSVGMGIDYGFTNLYIDPSHQTANYDQDAPTMVGTGWSLNNAYTWANQLINEPGNNQAGALRSFLSLYALSIRDGREGNGTWDDLPIRNELLDESGANSNAIRTALFGSGIQNNLQFFQNIWLGTAGKNTYKAMHAVMTNLGITAANGLAHASTPPHEHHFHADLRTPAPLTIGGNTRNLFVNIQEPTIYAATQLIQLAPLELEQQWKKDFEFNEGRMEMLILDLPSDLPHPSNTPMVMVVQKNDIPYEDKKRTIGACTVITNIEGISLEFNGGLSPVAAASSYLYSFESEFNKLEPQKRREILTALSAKATVTILRNPIQGSIVQALGNDGAAIKNYFRYIPSARNMSKDYFSAFVKIGGYDILIKYVVHNIEGTVDEYGEKLCKYGFSYPMASSIPYGL